MGTPWWGLSIWTGVWQEEKGGGVLFNLAECDRPPLPVVIWKTCEYSVLVPTGGREEGQLTLIKHLLPVGMSLGAGSPLARKEWEGGSGHDGGFWQNWDLIPSFLAWSCSCLLTPFPSLFINWSYLVTCLRGSALTHPEWKMRRVWGSYQSHLTYPLRVGGKAQANWGSGYWGTNAGDLRARLEEGLLMAARLAIYRSWNLRKITVFYLISAPQCSIWKAQVPEPAHLGLDPDSVTY